MRPLPALLLLLTIDFGAIAVTLRRRDSVDALDPGWGAEDLYYKNSAGLYCQKCPPGTYVAEECKEQHGSGKCQSCGYGEYMEYPNAFQWCRDCSKCREDQVQVSPCQPLRDAVCVCRNGTFCPPQHPCEMCQKCQPRCPEGQVVLSPCRPDSDLQCGPATGTVPSYPVLIGLVAFVVVFVVAFCSWKCCCGSPGDRTPSSRTPCKIVSSMFRKLSWYRRVNLESEDNAANAHLQRRHTEAQVMLQSGSGSPEKILVPASGSDPIVVLRQSFYTFARKVPKDSWKRFGRSLDLEENDVVTGMTDDAFYEMLLKWLSREGKKASVNALLHTLHRLHLAGVAEDISSTLLQDGLFQYETS